MNSEEYMKVRVEDQIDWYSNQSRRNQAWFKYLRAVEIVLGCAIAYLVGHAEVISLQVLTGAMGVSVAAIGGVLALFGFQEKWIEYRVTSESLKREKFFFVTGTAPYDNDCKFQILVTRVEAILATENLQWAEASASIKDRIGAGADAEPKRQSPLPASTS